MSEQIVIKLDKVFQNRSGGRGATSKRRMTVAECRPMIEEMEFERLINTETIQKEAIYAVENDGIVFLARLYCRSLFELKLEPICPRPHLNDPWKVPKLSWKGDDCEALLAGRD